MDRRERVKPQTTNLLWASALVLLGIVYVSQAWTPSSYAYVISYFDLPEMGLIAGEARPGRADEWGIATPLTQATVNNGFRRFNTTSFYQEDLRSVFSMPIRDWGLIFKPGMWLYGIANPAYAFSLYHFTFIVLFILGYALLFQALGSPPALSFLLAPTLLFTGYMQYWWTTFGHISSFFPWMLLLLLDRRMGLFLRASVFYWVAVCWMLSAHFYPPLFIQMAFICGLMIFAFRTQEITIRYLLYFAISSAAAVFTVLLYLKDPLTGMLTTIFPGQRITSGGNAKPEMALSQFLPLINIHAFRPLHASTVPETGVIGSYYFLAVLCFIDYRRTWQKKSLPRSAMLVLLGGLLVVYCWMFIELPSWVGAPLLWNRVPPFRMWFSAGFLTFILIFLMGLHGVVKINLVRFLLLVIVVVSGTFYFKHILSDIPLLALYKDVLVIAPIGILCFLTKKTRQSVFHTSVAAVAMVSGLWYFGPYNPIQSAWPIFNRPTTSVTQALDQLVKNGDRKKLAVPGFPGASLNGWGYPSVSHVLLVPPLEYWRRTFPDLSDEQFNNVFNRTAHIQVSNDRDVYLIHTDQIHVPIDAFSDSAPDYFLGARTIIIGQQSVDHTAKGGHIDVLECRGNRIKIQGWAPWHGLDSAQSLHIFSNAKFSSLQLTGLPRFDVVRHLRDSNYLHSGFFLTARLQEKCNAIKLKVCLLAEDSDNVRYLVAGSDISVCPHPPNRRQPK